MTARKVDSGVVAHSEPSASSEVQNTAPLSTLRRPFDLSAILGTTLTEESQRRRATAKHAITPDVITKQDRREKKKADAETFRKAVWARDKSRCRATKVKLSKGGSNPHEVGEVDHSIPRSLAPERIYDVTNGVLLSRYLNRLRKVACAEAPEFRMFEYTPVEPGEEDRGHKQRFLWRDKTGKVIKERIG